jgi:hypothetical protein
LTCALAVSLVQSTPWSWPPRIVIGSPPCSGSSTVAPIASRGRATRRIGRRLRLASPTKIARIGSAATTPAISRVVVPLLPQSSGAAGCESPRSPRPRTTMSGDKSGISAPSVRSTPAVE